jgi:UMF1 family MFS transporter
VLLQVVVLPVAGAIADRTRRKKELLALFAYIGLRRHDRVAVPHR